VVIPPPKPRDGGASATAPRRRRRRTTHDGPALTPRSRRSGGGGQGVEHRGDRAEHEDRSLRPVAGGAEGRPGARRRVAPAARALAR